MVDLNYFSVYCISYMPSQWGPWCGLPMTDSFTIFRLSWLAPITRLLLHYQPAITIFWRSRQPIRWYIVPIYIYKKNSFQAAARAAACLFMHEINSKSSRLSADEIAQFLTKTERKKCKSTPKILLDGCNPNVWTSICKKNKQRSWNRRGMKRAKF